MTGQELVLKSDDKKASLEELECEVSYLKTRLNFTENRLIDLQTNLFTMMKDIVETIENETKKRNTEIKKE